MPLQLRLHQGPTRRLPVRVFLRILLASVEEIVPHASHGYYQRFCFILSRLVHGELFVRRAIFTHRNLLLH
ncbi:hypothetical protein XFF7766_1010005 [Xanthomonas citri pv. fuscans]|nr:hypothetical protein XFF7766_1010005 [Xanthomonas citri pv. fuscans]